MEAPEHPATGCNPNRGRELRVVACFGIDKRKARSKSSGLAELDDISIFN
jgi:hypothetical protein